MEMKYSIMSFQQTQLIKHGLKIDHAYILKMILEMFAASGAEQLQIFKDKFKGKDVKDS